MPEMLEEVLGYLKNWFMVEKINGEFVIDKGKIQFPEGATIPEPEQYIRIFGSVFNDGLHMMFDDSLTDEVFTGTIWLLAVPTAVIKLSMEIGEYMLEMPNPATALKSESFDGYSYTRITRSDGTLVDWRDAFYHKLARWRKL